jgi:dolichol-phosphate mannosyltransferase
MNSLYRALTGGLTRLGDLPPGTIDLSVLIPVFNEQDNLAPLYQRLKPVLERLGKSHEIIFVDDGSADATAERLRQLAAGDAAVRVVTLRRNYGQTAAMMAGIDHARGRVLVAMDGDGQNDPEDIPRLLDELDKGFDVVSGWRKNRQDHASRTLTSRVANRLISFISGVRLHDYGCSLKAYRREVIKGVRLYGEMHRFVPIYAAWQGGRVSEIPVNHHPRIRGKSHYGFERIIKVLLDLVVVRFLDRYLTKPIYVFGGFGVVCFAVGFAAGAYALWLKYGQGISFIQTPLPVLVAMCLTTGMLSILMGLLAELLVRTYFEAQQKSVYLVRELINFD